MKIDQRRLAANFWRRVRSTRQTCAASVALVAMLPSVAASTRIERASLVASVDPGWPQFRGPRRDGISDERGLLAAWPDGGPRLLWSTKGAGRGFSSTIIGEGKIFVTGDFGEHLFVIAYDLDGKQLWRSQNGAAWLNQYQGARASVTYSSGRVYHENAHGRVACFDANTGAEIWAVDLLARFRGENITWGLSECLLVDERAVYATAGGRDALLVAFDKRTGELLWKSEPLFEAQTKEKAETAGYTSPILVQFADRRLIVGCSGRMLYCADAATGRIEWTRPRPTTYSVLAGTPVLVGDAIFMTAPWGSPGQLYRLVAPQSAGERVGVEDSWTTTLDTCQGGVVHVNGRLFGSYYPRRGGWAAVDATTGKVLYDTTEFVKGASIFADGRLYALCEDGWMLLFEPTLTQFEVKGRFRLAVARDRDAWAHPVIHRGRLYLRYHETIFCYDATGTRD